MKKTRVLVVDDSLTMRALISRVLETLPGIEVVGAADGAAEARGEVARLKPDVMTLDVEMPGMSGIEYLAELMDQAPMPVIMFSTKTEAGASSSIEALRLGAVDCFPKPKAASQGEFDAILAKLGTRIRSAKLTITKPAKLTGLSKEPFDWNGRMLAIGTDTSGTRKLFDLLQAFPSNCPPTLIVQHLSPDLSDSMISQLDAHVAPDVVRAEDCATLLPGKIYVTRPGPSHLGVDQWPGGRMRNVTRDPIAGERPSISLLFLSVAKAAAADAVGLMLTEAGEDGIAGMAAISKVGGHVIAPASLLGATSNDAEYTLRKGDASQPLSWADLATSLLNLCRR